MWIGYILSEDLIIGALNGALVGVFGGILSVILMLIMGSLGCRAWLINHDVWNCRDNNWPIN